MDDDRAGFTQRAAGRLAAKIRDYWAAQGKLVNVRIEGFRVIPGENGFTVRSDMVNGLPRSG